MNKLKILCLEPFYTGSHKDWLNGLKNHSSHDIEVLNDSILSWKWCMQTSALTFSEKLEKENKKYDLILASDMLDLARFKAFIGKQNQKTPLVIYFHENQITYPWSKKDKFNHINRTHYGLINLTSAKVADFILFNSEFHKNEFLNALPNFLNQIPNTFSSNNLITEIEKKSSVLNPGINLKSYNLSPKYNLPNTTIIVWNHRWEYDKNPKAFFDLCFKLKKQKLDFKLIVVGEETDTELEIFSEAKVKLKDEILHWGYVESREEYVRLVQSGDLLPVTSDHDFFGISVIEASYLGLKPLLPKKLNYPFIFNPDEFKKLFYNTQKDLIEIVTKHVSSKFKKRNNNLTNYCKKYDWSEIIPIYDETFSKFINLNN